MFMVLSEPTPAIPDGVRVYNSNTNVLTSDKFSVGVQKDMTPINVGGVGWVVSAFGVAGLNVSSIYLKGPSYLRAYGFKDGTLTLIGSSTTAGTTKSLEGFDCNVIFVIAYSNTSTNKYYLRFD